MPRASRKLRRRIATTIKFVFVASAGFGLWWAGNGFNSNQKRQLAGLADTSNLSGQAKQLFEAKCIECHGAKDPDADFDVLDFKRILGGRSSDGIPFINQKDPEKSFFYQQIFTDRMPKKKAKLSTDEKSLVLSWIRSEAKDSDSVRSFVSNKDIEEVILQDLKNVPQETALQYRYLTLTNFQNDARVTDAELERYRQAVSKALNSLSLAPQIAKPVPIDSNRVVFRIQLDQYGWTADTWEQISTANPYFIDNGTVVLNMITSATKSKIPYQRADWVVSVITQPKLYHDILKIPETTDELENGLGVNVHKDITEDLVSRAGFRGKPFGALGSGVSDNNRMIERHTIKTGAYWKSYDFSSSEGVQNLLERPLGPDVDGEFGFKHAGGEIIWNLPNGLQAYMLATAAGKRLDKAPENIVRDSTNGNRAVVNGISCMSCHVSGMQRKSDQVLNHVHESQDFYPFAVTREIERLYKEDSVMNPLFKDDEIRFRKALIQAGVNADDTLEPIHSLVQKFAEPVDFEKAAAEIGFPLDNFPQALASDKRLDSLKAELKFGGISRDQFIQKYDLLVVALKLGKITKIEAPPPAVAPQPIPKPDPASGGRRGGCFIAGTQISTPYGLKSIEDIKIGDEVLAYDLDRHQVVRKHVLKLFVHLNKIYGRLHLSNHQTIGVTSVHPFMLNDLRTWKKAGDLNLYSTLMRLNGAANDLEETAISNFEADVGTATVYNFEVEGVHNYFADGFLVHNVKEIFF